MAVVVNPNRPDCDSGCRAFWAAAGVTFVAAGGALNREARRSRGLLFLESHSEPDLRR